MRIVRFSLLFLLAILTAFSAVQRTSASGPVAAAFTTDAEELTVGDPIVLTLTVTHPVGYVVEPPALDSPWGPFVIVSQSPPEVMENRDGTASTRIDLDVRLFAPGSFSTPELSLTVADKAGWKHEAEVAPATLEVASVLVPDDTELRDIKPQVEISPWSGWTGVAGGSALVPILAISALILIRRRNNKTPIVKAPDQIAIEELTRIEALYLPAKGYFKEHYTLVSNCMRTYMEQAFDLSVWEHTTAEIQAALDAEHLAPEFSESMIDLLYASDIIKFSEIEPDVDSANRMVAAARWLVKMTKPSHNGEEAVEPAPELSSAIYEQAIGQVNAPPETAI